MVKGLIIASAIIAIAFAVPIAEKRRVSFLDIFKTRDPFGEPKYPQPPNVLSNIQLLNITQRVDNFNPLSNETFEQRYYSNDFYFEEGGPIFLFLGGEWEITDYRMTNSLMYNMASVLNGTILYLEHRYYGRSRPTPDVTDENLRFLNPEQALADAAHFINFIRSTVNGTANSPIILVGGHYSASLCVWFRQRYPHLTTGVWASSAPLRSVVDFDQFKVATAFAYRTVGGDVCYDALEAGFGRIHQMVADGLWEELTETFFLCDPLEPEDVGLFFTVIAEFYSILPQFEFEEFIASTCDHVVSADASVESIAYILNHLIDIVGGECVDIDYDAIVDADRQTEWDAPAVAIGYRQWTYTLCTQIGWFHTSGSPDQPFSPPDTFPIDFYMTLCTDVFGDTFSEERLNRNSERFNTIFGGYEPVVTNAIFTHGQHDPWNILGRRTNISDDAVAFIIQGGTMGNDLGPRHPDNPEPLREVKNRIEAIITSWVVDDD